MPDALGRGGAKPAPRPPGLYAGQIIVDTAGRGAVVNSHNGVIVLALDRDATRRYTVAQARKLAVELWQAAEALEVAEGEQPTRR